MQTNNKYFKITCIFILILSLIAIEITGIKSYKVLKKRLTNIEAKVSSMTL